MAVREHYSHARADKHQERKQEDAEARKEARGSRSDEQQIARLDSGHYTAVKERARLQRRIDVADGPRSTR